MKILLVSAEVSPFAKVGGLADVAGSLPLSIKDHGHDIRVIMPLYGSIDNVKYHLKKVSGSDATVFLGGRVMEVSLYEGELPNSDVKVYFVDNYEYFGSHEEIYPKKVHYRFEQERFVLFSLATLKLAQKIGFQPDVLHCNDWHTAHIPVYMKTRPWEFNFYSKTAIIYSIHNLAYQGLYSRDILDFAGLSQGLFNSEQLEFYNDVNWMKGGIIFSDKINTVSEKYAKEIQTPEYGEKLDGLLKTSKDRLSGILNGINTKQFDPETDPFIPANFSVNNLKGKQECKTALQKEFKLENSSVPIISIISRLVDQKGFDLIEDISKKLAGMDVQFIVLGTGNHHYEDLIGNLSRTHKNIRSFIGFDAKLAQRIYAGSDMFLMPSRFEPCGLGQLIALRYGTVPVVRATGGLDDTIKDFSKDKETGNGFVFDAYDSNDLLNALNRAIDVYNNKSEWSNLVLHAMKCDFSWDNSAKKYIALYESALRRFHYA